MWLEGNEPLAAYVLDYFKRIGVVRRWKEQPFVWLPDGAKAPRVPDFLVELAIRRQLIVQCTSRKYLTAQVCADFEAERETAGRAGMLHVVWTEERPFTRGVRTLFMRIRGARSTPHNPAALQALNDFVLDAGHVSVAELCSAGHEPALILVAVDHGTVFVKLTEDVNENTIVSSSPITDGVGFLLGSGFDPQGWWNGLPNHRTG